MGRSLGAATVALVVIALILVGAGIALVAVKRSGIHIGIDTAGFPQSSSSGGLLTEEIAPELVVTNHTITLEQGKVYELEYGPSGYIFQEKQGYKIIERVNLSSIDLSVNDVAAWHGFDVLLTDNSYLEFMSSFTTGRLTDVVMAKVLRTGPHDPSFAPHLVWHISTNNYEASVANGTKTYWSGRALGPIRVGEWQFVGARWAGPGNYIELWVDGNKETRDLVPSDFGEANSVFRVGATGWAEGWSVEVAFLAYWKTALIAVPSSISDAIGNTTSTRPDYLFDPTFNNGTHYIELITGAAAAPAGDAHITRIPAEHTWLWLIKNLESDNKLHLKYVPAGSVFRIYYNGIVREYNVDCTPNAVGLCEDYTIDLASDFGTTILSGASIELIYPSPKVRVYAPSGFIVKVVDSAGATWAEVEVSSGYVDLPIPSGQYTIMLIAKQRSSDVYIDFQKTPTRLIMTVTDIYGTPIGNALIIVRDTATKTIIYKAVADEAGQAEVPMNVLANYRYLTVEVKALYNGIIYETAVDYDLSANQVKTVTPQVTKQPQSASLTDSTKYILIGVGIVAIAAVVALAATRR